MSIYFPCFPSVPEEIIFEILKFIHPGAIWLFCRRVSRTWKSHVDANIERFYKFHVDAVKFERERANRICGSEESCGHLVQRLQADSLYVEIRWLQYGQGTTSSLSSLSLQFKGIELPPPTGKRDLGAQWDERVTFEPELKEVMVYGSEFWLSRIEDFVFPGFAPSTSTKEQHTLSDVLKDGTHTIQYGNYLVTYTIRLFGPGSTCGLAINKISVPMRSLLLFRVPYLVATKISGSGSDAKLRYLSPLFNTVEEEGELLPENVFARQHREEDEKWREVLLCEICGVNPLDCQCEMLRCEVCCWREGVCLRHLAHDGRGLAVTREISRRVRAELRRGERRVAIEESLGVDVEEAGSWAGGRGHENRGSNVVELSAETLVDGDGSTDLSGDRSMWLLKGYDVSTPPVF